MTRIYRHTYLSLNEFVEDGVAAGETGASSGDLRDLRDNENTPWAGGVDLREAKRLCVEGWPEGEKQALTLANEVAQTLEQDTVDQHFQLQAGVAGTPNIGAYLAGHPLCAWKPTLTTISTVGKTITLCASVCYSSSVTAETAIRRGAMITALALALEHTGHAVELWVDMTAGQPDYGWTKVTRVLVKGAHDITDPSRISFAYAHPAMLRILGFYEWHRTPRQLQYGYGKVLDPIEDLPEGTLYLPGLSTATGKWSGREPVEQIRSYLESIGLTR
jgi:hypothetical protein